jgi:hypothetical protein
VVPLNPPGLPVNSGFKAKLRRELDSSQRTRGGTPGEAVVLRMLRVRNALEGGAEGEAEEREDGTLCEAIKLPVDVEKVVACKVKDLTDLAKPRRYVVEGVTMIFEYIISELAGSQYPNEYILLIDEPLILRSPAPLNFSSLTIYTP